MEFDWKKAEKIAWGVIIAGLVLIAVAVTGEIAQDAKAVTYGITVTGYNEQTDYMALMQDCAEDGSKYALEMGRIYEQCRNLKITKSGAKGAVTNYFIAGKSAEQIRKEMKKPYYTSAEIDMLARVVMAEAGCNWFPDWVQQATAAVVLNRVESPNYPNTIKGVIYQKGQYGCVSNGSFYRPASEKVKKNVQAALYGKSGVPKGVIGQSGAVQGKIWKSYHDSVLGTTMYFCW